MNVGNKLFELKGKMDAVFVDAAAVQAKIDAGDNHLAWKTIATLVAFVGMVVSLTVAIEGGPYAIFGAVIGGALLIAISTVLGRAISAPVRYNAINRGMSERFESAQTEYRRVLENEAEAHGIDPGSLKSRERKAEENTEFTATRKGLPVSLTVEALNDTMVIKVNGESLTTLQTV